LKNYDQFFLYSIVLILTFTLTQRHLVVKVLVYILMLFIFSTPVLIRRLWQLKSVFFPGLASNMCCSIAVNTILLMKVTFEEKIKRHSKLFALRNEINCHVKGILHVYWGRSQNYFGVNLHFYKPDVLKS
jgi:hypothetical protein